MTPGIQKWLARTNHLGQIRYIGTRGLGYSVWERVMKRALQCGYVSANAFGEYEITDAGRAALAAADGAVTQDKRHG